MKYNYGQEVVVKDSAPVKYKPTCTGWIVGIRTADTEKVAREFNTIVGAGIYLIEFDDYPSGIEIPESFIS